MNSMKKLATVFTMCITAATMALAVPSQTAYACKGKSCKRCEMKGKKQKNCKCSDCNTKHETAPSSEGGADAKTE